MVQSGRTFESILDDLGNMLSSSLEEHVDPTPEAFLPSVLQAQMIPEEMQAGRLDEPYTTYVVQLEGTMLRKQFDRQAGFKHMIRPHAEDALRLIAKEGKGKSHVWFWGSESQAQASVMTESLFLGTEKERGVGMTTFQSLAPAFLGKEHRFKDHAGQEDAKERRAKGGEDDASASDTDVTQRLASEQFLVKRVQPLPRLSGSTILVDHELRNYQVNPDNTILLPEFKELKEDDNELLTLVAFIRLFRSLYKRKEVRTAKEAIAWLKARHPDIAINPFAMGQHIREESSVISRELALMERNSLSAAAKSVGRHTLIGAGRAITPATTRLTTDSMPEGSLVASRVAKVKSRNKAWQQEQAKAARKAAGEE